MTTSRYTLNPLSALTLWTALLLSGTCALAASTNAVEPPPTCPDGTHAVGSMPPAGFEWHCENAQGAAEGPWLTWYEDGQKMSERHMKNGREHGRQRSWWPNGQLMMEGVSVDGNRYQGFKYWGIDGVPARFEVQSEPLKLDSNLQPQKP